MDRPRTINSLAEVSSNDQKNLILGSETMLMQQF